MRNLVTIGILGALCAHCQTTGDSPDQTVSVLVYDFAGVPEAILEAGERQAQAIMRPAGVEIRWFHCPDASGQGVSGQPCPEIPGTLTLVLHILPGGATRRKTSPTALGFAVADEGNGFGSYAGIFYDRIQKLSSAIGMPIALGYGMAHELGHLLLGTGHHSAAGIMKADWRYKELKLAEQGSLRFQPAERRRIVDNLRRRFAALEELASSGRSRPPAPAPAR